jgi:hypothetical protein
MPAGAEFHKKNDPGKTGIAWKKAACKRILIQAL